VTRERRFGRLVPDGELVRRRAAGEALRTLAADYKVAHTTLGRYFARPEVARQVRDAGRVVRAEQRSARRRRTAERQMEGEIRREAKRDAELARSYSESIVDRSQRVGSPYTTWLDEHDRRRPWLQADLRSRNDVPAARVVEEGGGIAAVIDATGLRTFENVRWRIDPAVLVCAFDNDAADSVSAPPDRSRLRRLSPDLALLQRRAAGEPLRRLASDYGVAHTTLRRWFARPTVAGQMRALQRRPASGVAR
jgi:hypothetical protein